VSPPVHENQLSKSNKLDAEAIWLLIFIFFDFMFHGMGSRQLYFLAHSAQPKLIQDSIITVMSSSSGRAWPQKADFVTLADLLRRFPLRDIQFHRKKISKKNQKISVKLVLAINVPHPIKSLTGMSRPAGFGGDRPRTNSSKPKTPIYI
jgi:hypothetical protein